MVVVAVAEALDQLILQQLWRLLPAAMVTAMVTMQMESGPMTVANQAVNARQITIAMF